MNLQWLANPKSAKILFVFFKIYTANKAPETHLCLANPESHVYRNVGSI